MAASGDEAVSCNNLIPWRPVAGRRFKKYFFNLFFAFVKPRFTFWYGNLRSRTLISKENYIHYHFDAHGVFCYARSFASFGCPFFVLYLSLGLVKLNQRLIASDDICEISIVVFRELFLQLFCDSYPSKFFVLL